MPKIGKWIVLVFLGVFLLGVSALAQKTSNSKTKAKTNNTATKKVVVLPPAPHGPLPQIPLSQLPSAPAQVDCHNGLLTIVAQNSTLADILHDVQKCTGATIDVPPNASERVVTRLGPGPARDVLAALLNGSSFNYVMVGSTASPAALSSVLLSAKPVGGVTQAASVYQQPAVYLPPERAENTPGMGRAPDVYPQPIPNAQAQVAPAADETAADEEDTTDENTDDTADNQDQNGSAPAPQVAPLPPNAGPKTPEQILQMLQRPQQGVQNPPEQPPPPQ